MFTYEGFDISTENGRIDPPAVWACWLDSSRAIAAQIPNELTCPLCSGVIDLRNFKKTPGPWMMDTISAAIGCINCNHVVLVFDKTPENMRDMVLWRKKLSLERD
jgi:hypothetical protein